MYIFKDFKDFILLTISYLYPGEKLEVDKQVPVPVKHFFYLVFKYGIYNIFILNK